MAHLQVIDNCPRYIHAIIDLLKGVHCVQVVRGYLVVQGIPWTLQIARNYELPSPDNIILRLSLKMSRAYAGHLPV